MVGERQQPSVISILLHADDSAIQGGVNISSISNALSSRHITVVCNLLFLAGRGGPSHAKEAVVDRLADADEAPGLEVHWSLPNWSHFTFVEEEMEVTTYA